MDYEYLPQDIWNTILNFLTIDQCLTIRLLSKIHLELFQRCLPSIALRLDLPPCTTVKEFIRDYAHQHQFWRKVPSFSLQQRINFDYMKCKIRSLGEKEQEKFLQVLQITNSKRYKQYYSSRKQKEYAKRKNEILHDSVRSDWGKLDEGHFSLVRNYVIISGKHSFLLRLYREVCRRSFPQQREFFRSLLCYGISPYYLELFSNLISTQEKQNRKVYFSAICNNQNEYLLKKRLKQRNSCFVEKSWKWNRGEYLCKKYKR